MNETILPVDFERVARQKSVAALCASGPLGLRKHLCHLWRGQTTEPRPA